MLQNDTPTAAGEPQTAPEQRRGKLKIFFGFCAGVGKTYAMLSSGHERHVEGIDVVAGIIDTHDREETRKMLADIPVIPALEILRGDVTLKEFDIDAAKARKPKLILLDELAHTNAPGMRHPNRWNDVEELLNAGIDVYTTLSVQHLESMNDLVAGISGVLVKETVPDSIFDSADDIVLVDINADELLQRRKEGKVQPAEQNHDQSNDEFFKKSNLIALRELALRRTTERVDAQMDAYKMREGIKDALSVTDKVMVCIGPDPLSAKLVRTAKRMATSLKAPWVTAYVENARHYRLNERGKALVQSYMRMADRIGGKAVVLQGNNAVDEIIAYARANGVTKIVLGKQDKPRWKDILFGSLVEAILRKSDNIDVYVVTGEISERKSITGKNDMVTFKPSLYWRALLTVTLCTLINFALQSLLQPIDQLMIYLMGVVLVATRYGRGPSLICSFLSVSAFNFFFITPLYSFNLEVRSYWMTLLVMLATSIIISYKSSQLRLQAIFSRQRERDTQTLYKLTREMASTRGQQNISEITARHVEEVFGTDVTIWVPDKTGVLSPIIGALPELDIIKETGVLHWSYNHNQLAGRDTSTMPSAIGLYLPLHATDKVLGVLGVLPRDLERHFSLEEITSLETFASLFASALERVNAAATAEKSRIETEGEKLRNILLSSVSHDLRTPLASITGASSTIVMDGETLPRDTIRDLGRSINKEASRLSRIVTNLLDVTSLESGTVQLNSQPYYIEELIGSARVRLESALATHTLITNAEPNLPMVVIDGVLVEQVLANLLENAAKYTPSDSTITIDAHTKNDKIIVSISDNGKGIHPGEEKRLFDKFYTATQQDSAQKGTGLGLAICQGIITAHHGEIWAENLATGGARFSFTLPIARNAA